MGDLYSMCRTDGGEKPWRDRQRMLELYEEKDYTYAEIADMFGCTDGTVSTWMKKHKAEGIREGLDVDIPENNPHRDRDLMETLYVNEQLSITEISAITGSSTGAVRDWLHKHDLDVRSSSEGISVARGGEKGLYYWTNKAFGYEVFKSGRTDAAYHHRLLCVAEYGFDAVAGKDVHHKNGIPWDNRPDNLELLTPSEHQREEGGFIWLDELRSVEMYREGLSSYDISEVVGCSPSTAIAWVKSFDEDLVRNVGGGAA